MNNYGKLRDVETQVECLEDYIRILLLPLREILLVKLGFAVAVATAGEGFMVWSATKYNHIVVTPNKPPSVDALGDFTEAEATIIFHAVKEFCKPEVENEEVS